MSCRYPGTSKGFRGQKCFLSTGASIVALYVGVVYRHVSMLLKLDVLRGKPFAVDVGWRHVPGSKFMS